MGSPVRGAPRKRPRQSGTAFGKSVVMAEPPSQPRRTTVTVRRRIGPEAHSAAAVTRLARVLVSAAEECGTDPDATVAGQHDDTAAPTATAAADAQDGGNEPPSPLLSRGLRGARGLYPTLSVFRSHWAVVLPLLLGGLLYLNSLNGEFCFDDHFALVDNPDSNPRVPLLPIFFHDFWGAPLSSNSSHKSFRPLTILSWRLTRLAIETIVGQEAIQPLDGVAAPPIPPSAWKEWFLTVATPSGSRLQSSLPTASPSSSPTASVLIKHSWYPFLFHFENVLLHVLCTLLVYVVAFHVFHLRVMREEDRPAAAAAERPASKTATAAMPASTTPSSTTPNIGDHMFRRRAIFLSFCSALLFAAHPIHTEAVSGVVGHAELLSCVWFLLSFLLWWWSNLLLTSTGDSRGGVGVGVRAFCTNMALVCFLAATLCKEIAITLVAVFVCIDLLHAAIILAIGGIAVRAKAQAGTGEGQQAQRDGGRRAESASADARPPTIGLSTWLLHLLSLVWPRFLLLTIVSTFYLVWRRILAGSTVGVGHAVFRSIENPLAFEASAWTRTLTHMMLHGKYAQLLVAPLDLSADYSFNCLPLVTSILDLRWARGFLAYAVVFGSIGFAMTQLVRLLNAKRVETMRLVHASAGYVVVPPSHGGGGGFWTTMPSVPFPSSEWHLNLSFYSSLLISLGLLVFPFLPASNLFFYVGTFVAERVLYIPSVGFVMLGAILFERLLFAGLAWTEAVVEEEDPAAPAIELSSVQPTPPSASSSASRRSSRSLARNRASLLLLPFLGVLAYYSLVTYQRNPAWRTEETLFTSAHAVCPTSVKVLQNFGILQRRHHAFHSALAYFAKIPKIDPTYCEHTYWLALTRINLNSVALGVQLLKESLACPFTRVKALSSLHMLYEEMLKINTAPDEGAKAAAHKSTDTKKGKGATSAAGSSSPSGAAASMRHEWEILGEWSEIMQLVDQRETSAKYAIHAGTLSFSAGNYTAALALFQRAHNVSRALVYDRDGRLVSENGDASGLGLDQQSAAVATAATSLGPGGSGPADDPSSKATIFTSHNYRCGADYWLGRTHLMLGHFLRGCRLLRTMVEAVASMPPRSQCADFKLHGLDHIAEYAQRELQENDAAVLSKASQVRGGDGQLRPAPGLVSKQSEAHALLAFVLSQLGKNVTAAQHYHAAAHMLDKAAAADMLGRSASATAARDVASASRSDRLKAIEYYRLSLAHDPTVDRARYSLAIVLIETGHIEEGVSLLRASVASSDGVVRQSSQASLEMLYSTYGRPPEPASSAPPHKNRGRA